MNYQCEISFQQLIVSFMYLQFLFWPLLRIAVSSMTITTFVRSEHMMQMFFYIIT